MTDEQQPQRIDMLVHELNHSGVSNAAVTLANGLVNNGIGAQLIVIGEENSTPFKIDEKVQLKFLGIKRGRNFIGKVLYLIRAYFVLSIYLARSQSGYIFAWGKEFTALAVFLRLSLPLPFKIIGVNTTSISLHLLHSKNAPVRYISNWIYKKLMEKAEHIIAQSSGMVEELKNIYKIPEDKISVIYPPMQAKFFGNVRQKNKTGKILFVGKLSQDKGVLYALAIFNKLKNKQATLEFIGEGDLELELKETTTQLGLAGRVSFAGRQSDIVPYLQNADVLILTSKYEGFGMVLAESIASGVPVVSFNCPSGPSEIIIEGTNGYLIPEGNVDLFAKKLDQALTKEWDARKIAETAGKFHPDIVIKKYIEVIKKEFGE